MVTLFLCWFCFVLLRVFSDDTNSKQKTPHKVACTWQTCCWWDIQSLHYHSNKNARELVESNIHHCNKMGPQQPTRFFWWGNWWWTQHINQLTCLWRRQTTNMARLSESERSQILQLLFSCSLLIYFLFWDSWIGTLCGQPSILVRQREVIVNFRLKMDAQKAANWRRVMLWHTIILGEVSRIRIVIWDTGAVWCFSPLGRQHQVFDLMANESQRLFVPVRFKILHFLPVRLNQSSFFAFFESSIMCKIGPGSRLGCRACCVSGKALSEGGFALNTRLVYFVSEQVFPSGAWFKSALPLYQNCHMSRAFDLLICGLWRWWLWGHQRNTKVSSNPHGQGQRGSAFKTSQGRSEKDRMI